MKRQFVVFIFAFMTIFFAGVGFAIEGWEQSYIRNDYCLDCHGAYADLVAMEPAYKYIDPQDGTEYTINPHKYWSHSDVSDYGTPDCVRCHVPHDEDIDSADKVVKADVSECFGCHHTYNFRLCGDCH